MTKYNPLRLIGRTALFIWALIESPWKKGPRKRGVGRW
jgi:hypothetical protein